MCVCVCVIPKAKLFSHPFGWGCKTRRLYLCRVVRPHQ